MLELLAPAGNEESFFAAINNGADAVYLGLSDFSARKNAANFSVENLAYYVNYAHLFNAKVYVAVNTLVKNDELDDFFNAVQAAYLAGADAFIVQDVFLGKPLKERFPDITLHLSTQGGVNNAEGAIYAKNHGFSRVILARETALSEIKQISEIIETEIFVHGALCSCFSGHCYMSSFIGGNSGNRGFCKQPCRKKYSLTSKTEKGDYSISLADLNLSCDVAAIKQSGVKSVKIEGRMRAPEYVAAAVKLYRAAIDDKPFNLSEIKRTFNRGNYTKGYIFGFGADVISDKIQSHIGENVGFVSSIKGNTITVSAKEHFSVGDGFKILRNGEEVGGAVCCAKGKTLEYKGKVKIGDQVNITKDVSLANELLQVTRLKSICVKATVGEGTKLVLQACGYKVESETAAQTAKTSALTQSEIRENLLKTDKYPFEIEPEITIEGKPFLPKSQLNATRAALYAKIFTGNVPERRVNATRTSEETHRDRPCGKIIISDKLFTVSGDDLLVYFPDDYDSVSLNKSNAYLFVPSFLTSKDISKIKELSLYFKGFYADGLSGLYLAESLNKPFIAGLGLNVFNSTDVSALFSEGAQAVVLSKELSLGQAMQTSDCCAVFTRGNIRLMELLYCPFGKKCANCNRGNDFVLRDELGHEFKLRRYKLNGRCRFEIYNDAILFYSNKQPQSELINLVRIDDNIRQKLIAGDDGIIKNVKTTVGNLKRGVN